MAQTVEEFQQSGNVNLGDLRINDINFVIPPESISIVTNEYDASTFMLREAIPSTVKVGKKKVNIHVPIPVDLDDPRMGYEQVSKLLIQIRKSPIVTVENEKIRKEILGINGVEDTSIGLLVENISGYIDREFPSLLRLDLQMTWFNHLPYTPNLVYRGDRASGEAPISKAPTSLFKEFYKFNTEESGVLINNPNPSIEKAFFGNDLELFYKEYQNFPESIESAPNPVRLIKDGPSSKLEKRKKLRKVNVDQKLKQDGWVSASEHWGYDNPDSVYYRWRRIEIPTTALGESGALILEDINFSITTNIAYIPLQGYSVPTAQFMGGSIGKMRGILFAAPEYSEDNAPKETSRKLSRLQKIFDRISENRLQHSRYAKEDFLLVRHPLAKLLKYVGFEEKRPSSDAHYYDPDIQGTLKYSKFNYNDMLPVVLSNRTSDTVEGLPFASRLQFDLKETRLREDNDLIRLVGEGDKLSRTTIRESWLNTLKEVEERYKIGLADSAEGKVFRINSEEKNPDRATAENLVIAMNGMFSIDSRLKDVEGMFGSELFKMNSSTLSSKLKKRTRISQRDLSSNVPDIVSFGLVSEDELYLAEEDKLFLNSEGVSNITIGLLKAAAEDNFEGWAKKYSELSLPIRSFNSVPESPSYPDLHLPADASSPTYYFQDFDDESIYKIAAAKGMLDVADKVEKHMKENFQTKESANKLALESGDRDKRMLPASGGVSPATNLAASEDKAIADKHGAVHNVADEKHRRMMAVKALEHSTSVVNSMKYAYPAFKVYLKQSNVLFERELSISDLSEADRNDLAGGFRDFSEHFDVSNIIDIRILKDETNPADLMVMRVVATEKDKVNRLKQQFREQQEDQELTYEKVMDLLVSNSEAEKDLPTRIEKRLKRGGLTEGTRIQTRVGYSPNPNELPVEFNGKIVSVRGRDIIEVICLGNGEELVQEIKAVNGREEYTFNSNTPNLIAKVLSKSPEIVSFGNINYKSDFGVEIPIFPAFLGGTTVLDNIFAPSLFDDYVDMGTEFIDGASFGLSAVAGLAISSTATSAIGGAVTSLAITTVGITSTTGGALAAVGGIIAGGGVAAAVTVLGIGLVAGGVIWAGLEVGSGVKKWLFGSPFNVYNNTVWEVLNELTLRHPGTIVSVVPYDNRSTIYFGEPNQNYFHRGPTPFEAGVIASNSSGVLSETSRQAQDRALDLATSQSGERRDKTKKLRSQLEKNQKITDQQVILNMQKPFRTYHLVSSEHDIVKNEIEVTSRGVANSVQVSYPNPLIGDPEDNGNFDGSRGFSGYDVSDEIQADDDIYKEYIKKKVYTFHNAHTETVDDMPQRYAKAVLCKELEKVYRGKIVILGRAGVKPHDVLILRDTYNGMTGPVGVSRVTHIVSPQGGWVTEIVPKMMVFPDNASGMYQLSLVLKGTAFWLSDEVEKFYTNVKRFMPNEHDSFTENQDRASAFNYLFGPDFVDLEDKSDIDNLKSGNVNKQEKTYVETLQQTTLSDQAKVEASVLGGSLLGETGGALATPLLRAGLEKSVAGVGTNAAEILAAKSLGGVGSSVGKTALSAGGVLLKGGGVVLGTAGGIVTHLLLNSLINGFVNWSKYRQPILFYPLTRNGEPWYAAMNGFKDNTIIGHYEHQFQRGIDRLKFYNALAEKTYNGYAKHLR